MTGTAWKPQPGAREQNRVSLLVLLLIGCSIAGAGHTADANGCQDHPAVTRFPDAVLAWCQIDNFLPYRIPTGPVTGYRTIADWVDVEGRVTRNFYSLVDSDRTHAEVYANFREALTAGGFELVVDGLEVARNVGKDVGGAGWLGVYYAANRWSGTGEVAKLVSGTSTGGGTGALIARKRRATDTIWALVTLEQHSATEVAALVTVVETKAAETGLVTADADAMGEDLETQGRTVLRGLFFEHNSAVLKPESAAALQEIARLLNQRPAVRYYVVGHTDSSGTFAYNRKLSADRALAVREALIEQQGIAADRLEAHGVGPLVPVSSNAGDAGRAENRRVELVQR